MKSLIEQSGVTKPRLFQIANYLEDRVDELGFAFRPDEVTLRAPIKYPWNLLAAGLNYRAHAGELGERTTIDPERDNPFLFAKSPRSTIIDPGQPFVIPRNVDTLDWEGEFSIVMGREAKNLTLENAMDYVFGFTILYDVSDRYTLYASYAETFDPQERYTFEGELLDPLQGGQTEFGVKTEYLDGALSGTLALFQINEENRAQRDPRFPDESYYIPVGEVESRGVDLEVVGHLTPGFRLSASYSYTDTIYKIDRTSGGDPSTREGQRVRTLTPERLVKLWLHWRAPAGGSLQGLSLGAGVNTVSDYYSESNGIRLMPPLVAEDALLNEGLDVLEAAIAEQR